MKADWKDPMDAPLKQELLVSVASHSRNSVDKTYTAIRVEGRVWGNLVGDIFVLCDTPEAWDHLPEPVTYNEARNIERARRL